MTLYAYTKVRMLSKKDTDIILYQLHPCPIYTNGYNSVCIDAIKVIQKLIMVKAVVDPFDDQKKNLYLVLTELTTFQTTITPCTYVYISMPCAWSSWILYDIIILFLFLVSSHSLRYIPFGSIFGVFTDSIYGVYVASGCKTFPKHAAKYVWR